LEKFSDWLLLFIGQTENGSTTQDSKQQQKKLKHPQAQSPIATSQALWRSLDVLEVSLLATKSSQ
jgi:hypothetical protein